MERRVVRMTDVFTHVCDARCEHFKTFNLFLNFPLYLVFFPFCLANSSALAPLSTRNCHIAWSLVSNAPYFQSAHLLPMSYKLVLLYLFTLRSSVSDRGNLLNALFVL